MTKRGLKDTSKTTYPFNFIELGILRIYFFYLPLMACLNLPTAFWRPAYCWKIGFGLILLNGCSSN